MALQNQVTKLVDWAMDKVAALEQRKRKLEEKLRAAQVKERSLISRQKAEERKLDARRKIIIGGAVIAAVRAGKLKKEWLEDLLDVWVTREKDRDVLGLDVE